MKQLTVKQAKRFKKVSATAAVTLMLSGGLVPALQTVSAADKATDQTAAGSTDGLAVTPDATALNNAVKDATAAGVKVTQSGTKTTSISAKDASSNTDRIDKSYADKVAELKDLTAKQKAADEKYTADKAQYDKDLKAYNDAVAGQTSGANPNNPLQPALLNYEQPINLNNNPTSLKSISVSGTKYTDPTEMPDGTFYNSKNVTAVKVTDNTKPIVLTYENVATDKATGKKLNATVTLSNFATSPQDWVFNTQNSYILVYSNYVDNVSLANVTAAKQKFTLSYADGTAYDNKYYLTTGSLNFQDGNRYEFSSPDQGQVATFLNKDTLMSDHIQNINGSASKSINQAFMAPIGNKETVDDIPDTSEDALTKLGVTYLVNNGSSFWVGVSGNKGAEPQGSANYWSIYNHIMIGANTVAPTAIKPVAPKEPSKLATDYQLENLLVTPDVSKDVDAGFNEGNIAGSANGQTFMIGDKLTYSLGTSALPADRDAYKTLAFTDTLPAGFTYKNAKAFDASGKDVSNQFTFTEKDGKLVAQFTDAALKSINDAKAKATALPTVEVYGVAAKNGVTLSNSFNLEVDGTPFKSNVVATPVKDITVHKDVEVGVKDTATGESIDGKSVLNGQDLTYELSADDLPANRATNIASFGWTDKLPKYVDYVGFKVVNAAGEDVTQNYTYSGDKGRNFKLTRNSTDDMNADKKTAFKQDTVLIHVKANESGVNFKNTATLDINGQDKNTNTVNNQTPDYHPEKKDLDDKGNNINGKSVKPGDTIHYEVIGDLTDYANMAVTPDKIDEETFGLTDNYDESRLDVTEGVQNDFSIELVKPSSTDAKAAEGSSNTDSVTIGQGTADKFDMNDVTVNWDLKNGRWTVTPKDPISFLQKYAGDQLVVKFNPIVKDGATGVIKNTATQTTFGTDKDTNKVKNPITENIIIDKHKTINKSTTINEKHTHNEKNIHNIDNEKNVTDNINIDKNKDVKDHTNTDKSSIGKDSSSEDSNKDSQNNTPSSAPDSNSVQDTAPTKQLPNTGTAGPIQQIANFVMGLFN